MKMQFHIEPIIAIIAHRYDVFHVVSPKCALVVNELLVMSSF